MKKAVIISGGKQYVVAEGDIITVEKIDAEPNAEVALPALAMFDESGKTEIGTPHLTKKVPATVLEIVKDEKIPVIKFKNKIRYKRNVGHRQQVAKLKIGAIA